MYRKIKHVKCFYLKRNDLSVYLSEKRSLTHWWELVTGKKEWVRNSRSISWRMGAHSHPVLLDYLHLGSGCPLKVELLPPGVLTWKPRVDELLGWTEGFSSLDPVVWRNSLFWVWMESPFTRRWQCWVRVVLSVLNPSIGEHLLCARQWVRLTVLQAGGRIDITIMFYKEEKLEPREGGLRLLRRCFVYSATDSAKYAIFFPRKVPRITFPHTQSRQGLRHYPESHAPASWQLLRK